MSRYDYVKYDEAAIKLQEKFKAKFMELDEMLGALDDGRATSLVHTHLEIAYMWIGKAIRDEQVARGSASLQEERVDS